MGYLEALIDRDVVREADVVRAREVAERTGGRLAPTLVRLGMVAENDLAEAISTAEGMILASATDLSQPPPAIPGINPAYLQRHALLPLSLEERCLTVAVGDPSDEEALDALAFAAEADLLLPVIGTFSDIDEALSRAFPEQKEEAPVTATESLDDMERIAEGDSEAPIIRMVHRLLSAAVTRRASDVHIEPMARHLVVRYRIDGRLVEVERHPEMLAAPIASRIKVMAGLDIAESRLPQDGRLRLTVKGRDVDVRVSTSPIAHGESIVMRLLGRGTMSLNIDDLGIDAQAKAVLLKALDHPHGIILMTGPTGSGKTTTLYSALNRLRRPDVKILTVEDPVEVMLEGINQVQIRPEIDLTYANALRAFLRQDPDILMIGEIRDGETADIAMRAALTGHLVLSTLHTNSALGAFTRLADIGVEPFLTASTVIATAAQRLVRTLCEACADPQPLFPMDRQLFVEAGMEPPALVKDAKGCSHCGQTGYRGRRPLIEIIAVDDALRAAVRTGQTHELENARPAAETLWGKGLAMVAEGLTSLTEVRRAVGSA